MPLVVATADERRQHHLLEHRRMQIGRQARRDEPRLQVARHDEESEPQRREQRLAERSHVDHPAIGIERVQARQRLALDSACRSRSRPRRSTPAIGAPIRATAWRRSRLMRDAQRELARRRHVREPRIAARAVRRRSCRRHRRAPSTTFAPAAASAPRAPVYPGSSIRPHPRDRAACARSGPGRAARP